MPLPDLKGGRVTFYEQMVIRYQKLNEEIEELQQEISTLPEGEFYCTRNRRWYKWYQSQGKGEMPKYIPKSDRDFAQQLAYKKYLTLQFKYLIQEKEAIELYFEKCSQENSELNQFIQHPECQKLLLPTINKKSKGLMKWMKEPYDKCTSKPGNLIHRTVTGEMVRSKAESLIYMYLHMNHIPFRYDAALQLGQTIYYPDFTIRHPKTGEYYYWENHGMMDDPAYIQRTFSKLEIYTLHGLIPGKHLITTYETLKEPLDAEEVQEIVRRYFL